MEDKKAASAALVARFISQSFIEKRQGNSKNYHYLVQQLSTENDPVAMQRWIFALAQCASLITKDFHQVVDVVFSQNWLAFDEEYIQVYTDFVEHLLSANAYFTKPCLQMIVANFAYSSGSAFRESFPTLELAKPLFEHLHYLLAMVLRIVPTSLRLLQGILEETFPHKHEDLASHTSFVQNLFRMIEHHPELLNGAVAVLIDKLIQIDVEIQVDLVELDDVVAVETEEEDHGMMFDVELNEDPAVIEKRDQVRDLIEKLDTMLLLSFDFLERCLRALDDKGKRALFNTLLELFEHYVMQTNRCRYTQFLFFSFASSNAQFPDIFLSFLIHILADTAKSTSVRQSAAAYLASFIARSNRVSIETVRRCLELLSQWTHSFLDFFERGNASFVDPMKHSIFYYVCQGMFYIFCFRHQMLLQQPDGHAFMMSLNLDRIINSSFNPLKVCLPSVVSQFAKTAKRYEVVYCYTIMERNRKLLQKSRFDELEFESFFAFEPYQLKKSCHYVEPIYQRWEPIEGDSSDEGSDVDSDDDDMIGSMNESSYDNSLPTAAVSAGQAIAAKNGRGKRQLSINEDDSELVNMILSPESVDRDFMFQIRSPKVRPTAILATPRRK